MGISKLWFGALGVSLVFALGGCGAPGSGPSLATVGDSEITVADFEFAALEHPLIRGDRSPDAKTSLLEDLIDAYEIIATIAGLDPKAAEARAVLEEQAESAGA